LPKSNGIGPFIGIDDVSVALAGAAANNWLETSSIRREVTKLVVDGDTAVALEHKTAVSHEGANYVNDYCWVYTCREGRIVKIVNYTDTLYASAFLTLPTPTHG
jgi:ketosteroid isomerase-like protein